MGSNKIYNVLLGLIFIPNTLDGPAKIGKKFEVDILMCAQRKLHRMRKSV